MHGLDFPRSSSNLFVNFVHTKDMQDNYENSCAQVTYIISSERKHRELCHYVYVLSPDVGIGQSSSVMLDQKTHIMTTDSSVKNVSKRAPSILWLVP